MKLLLVIAGALYAQSADNKSDLWRNVAAHAARPLHEIAIPSSERKAVIQFLKARTGLDGWSCATDDPAGDWLTQLKFESMPLSPRARVLLVEAGPGCARGGQGSNGAMWLVRFDKSKPILLASPEQGFDGWVYSIEQATSNGYRDIVLGWHGSAFEAILTYFRFDGRSYRSVTTATLRGGSIIAGKR